MFRNRLLAAFLVFALTLPAETISPEVRKALDSIRPSELKGDLSFIASDLLQGRYTPSPGLDIAAAFIASKFRAAGLEPLGDVNTDEAFFQIAHMIDRKLPQPATPLTAQAGDKTITVDPAKINITKASTPAEVNNAPVIKVAERNPDKLMGLDVAGKVVLVPNPDFAALPAADRMNVYRKAMDFDKAVASAKALLEVVIVNRLRPQSTEFLFADDAGTAITPVVRVDSPELSEAVLNSAALTLSIKIPAPEDTKSTVQNVVGILPGSDPILKSTCVLVTAHYDHIGTVDTARSLGGGDAKGEDKIFNGANDDGSGTVSVIEIARALSQLHPKRSIVFVTFFGEERGLFGSTFYGRQPAFPVAKTVADINLEQVGRTDATEGPEVANASLTGYDYSNVTTYLENAGKLTGIKIYRQDPASDEYFVRSDNAALAEQGVPAHTLTTAFEYPDYHGLGDEWQKIDYENMAKVDRTVALAVLNIANSKKAPEWNADNPKTEHFREKRVSP